MSIILKFTILAIYCYALFSEHVPEATRFILGTACTLARCDDFKSYKTDPALEMCKHSLDILAQRILELETRLKESMDEGRWARFTDHEDDPEYVKGLMACLSERVEEKNRGVGKREREEVEEGGEGEEEAKEGRERDDGEMRSELDEAK
ncbi:uncharacterized protein J4E87_007090 [Alternaria ethzedia]|uniref:uncharacterized protein n=1 Tax=Alternaria ethzedia TaxID=181014 RepID=UPI0020C28356|nr:uncharacterized protein J4E87_007090 [Alternaria ethzedia]KAI4620762.1 hypothetical protein J4E87_007090 [Alternaria ethzedia]